VEAAHLAGIIIALALDLKYDNANLVYQENNEEVNCAYPNSFLDGVFLV